MSCTLTVRNNVLHLLLRTVLFRLLFFTWTKKIKILILFDQLLIT
jgi:hypothetical protein